MTFFGGNGDAGAKRAKILTDAQIKAALASVPTVTDRLMVLLSVRAGFRACEISGLKWSMVTDAEGQVWDSIHLTNEASKGANGGREVPMHPDIRAALLDLAQTQTPPMSDLHAPYVIRDRKGRRVKANAIAARFLRIYRSLGFQGASSHSGRRTFITRLARKIVEAGGSLRDVQQLAGHASLSQTQVYIEGSSDAKRRVIGMI